MPRGLGTAAPLVTVRLGDGIGVREQCVRQFEPLKIVPRGTINFVYKIQ
jgi:hypothetical protein